MRQITWQPVYIGVGSNLERPVEQVSRAIAALELRPEVAVIAISPYVRNPALGDITQPDFVNAVVGVLTTLEPEPLLDVLQTIERDQGRVRDGAKWGARTIDLDVLVYAQRVINTERLTVPHAQMHKRNFVLGPLHEIAPYLMIPKLGTVNQLITTVSLESLDVI